MQNEIDMKDQYKEMQMEMRSNNQGEKIQKDNRWPNMYGDQDPLPVVGKNLDKNSTYVATFNQD